MSLKEYKMSLWKEPKQDNSIITSSNENCRFKETLLINILYENNDSRRQRFTS
jgi:hypothetical protein